MGKWKENIDTNTATGDMPVMTVKEYTVYDLWQQAWSKAGKSLFYMQFIHADDKMFNTQAVRVERMCYHLAAEWRNHIEEIEENKKWFRDWIEKFDNEVENQC